VGGSGKEPQGPSCRGERRSPVHSLQRHVPGGLGKLTTKGKSEVYGTVMGGEGKEMNTGRTFAAARPK